MTTEIKYHGISRYLKIKLNSIRKEAKEDYIQRFDPFYDWKVGQLSGVEIKEALAQFISTGERPTVLNTNSYNLFSILVECYKNNTSETNSILKIISKDFPDNNTWLRIRACYKKELSNQYDGFLGNLEFKENIDYEKPGNKESIPNPEDSFGQGNYNEDAVEEHQDERENGEKTFTELAKDEIELILDNLYLGNWVVKMIQKSRNDTEQHFAILNLNLPAENKNNILDNALSKVENYFGENNIIASLELVAFNNNLLIKGYFRVVD